MPKIRTLAKAAEKPTEMEGDLEHNQVHRKVASMTIWTKNLRTSRARCRRYNRHDHPCETGRLYSLQLSHWLAA